MNFTFVNSTVRSSIWINILRKCIQIKSPSLPGSDIVGEAFLKSLSIVGKVGWWVSLPLLLKLNEFHFCKQYCQVFNIDKNFEEMYTNKES